MKLVAFGTEPVGVVAIGANATGILAVGQLATGVVAVGQLARGVIVVGQLGLGLVTLGQLGLGVLWCGGMAGVGATAGPGLVGGLFGRFYLLRLFRRSGPAFSPPPLRRPRVITGTAILTVLAGAWWLTAGRPVVDAVTRTGGIFVEAPPPLPCEPLC